MEDQLWIANQVGEFLALGNTVGNHDSPYHLLSNLQRMLVELTRGNQQLLGRQTRISSAALNAWLTGKRFPSLALVIRLCQNLRVPIKRLVMEEVLRTYPEWSALATSGSLATRRKQRLVIPQYPITRVVRLGPIPPEERERAAPEIKARLETNLAMDEPLSILTLFQIMGYRSTSRGKAWFPALCAATKAKRERQAEHRAETYQQELLFALTEELPPTIAQVALQLGISVPQLYLRHTRRELCKVLAARSPDRRRFQRTKTEEALRTALEQPPVPLVFLASRLQKDANTLRVVFPDLCQRLRVRYMAHRALEGKKVGLA